MSGSIITVFVRRRELSGSIAGETSVSGGEGNDDRRGAWRVTAVGQTMAELID